MHSIKGYTLKTSIQEGHRTIVYKAIRDSDGLPVILKAMHSAYPTLSEIESLKREYEINSLLDNENIIKAHGLFNENNIYFIVFEDFGGIALRTLLKEKKIGINEFTDIAIQITRALDYIHRQGVLHKDIKPQNILINPESKLIKIADFGIASRLDHEQASIQDIRKLEGTLAYISPEQSGRMNRILDYRSDFYSLGATFYEILTGRLVFESDDPMDMIHCHIARQPAPPSTLDPSIPEIISKIIMILLSKNAEDRYQSANGITKDLEECRRLYISAGSIENFTPMQWDYSLKFRVSEKLYGREEQLNTLIEHFNEARNGGCEILMVSGYSGIGKSSLVNEINKPIVESRGIYLSGKYDQFKRNIPYSALIEAFQHFLRHILTSSEEELALWREKIQDKLTPNAQVIIDVIPEVELILGPQPPVTPLEGAEAQNRFNLVLKEFLGVFAQPEHPLALHIDDLQWADTPTLTLLKSILLDPNSKNLLLIGSYRDNEVDDSHPLLIMLGQLRKEGKIPGEINLQPLGKDDLNLLLADTMRCSLEKSAPLGELIMKKTLGNPFFVGQFLKTLQERNLIKLNQERGGWDWELKEIKDLDITDNVVDLMSERLDHLPEETRNMMKLAACSGSEFYLHTLAIISEKTTGQTLSALQAAINEGFIYALAETGPAHITGEEDLHENIKIKFLHDRVQQAAYTLIEEKRRNQIHLKIGRLLLKNTPEDELDDNLFEITQQLNAGEDLLEQDEEKLELAQLNNRAGKKAKESTAYEPAITFFNHSLRLLSADPWDRHYEMAFSIYRDLGEAEYLNGNFEESERLFVLCQNKAQNAVQKAVIQNLFLTQCINTGRQIAGIESSRPILELLGHSMPSPDSLAQINDVEFRTIPESLGGREIASLIDANELQDVEVIYASVLLITLWAAAYTTGQAALCNWCIFRLMNTFLKHGNNALSAYAYVVYGDTLATVYGQFQDGYEWGKLGVALLRKLNARGLMCKTLFMYSISVQSWMEPLNNTTPLLREAYEAGVDSGDLLYGGYSIIFILKHRIMNGDQLNEIYEQEKGYELFLYRSGDIAVLKVVRNLLNSLLALEGKTSVPFELSSDNQNEHEYEKELQEPANILWRCWYLNARLQISYISEDYQKALWCVESGEAIGLRMIFFVQFQVTEYSFYAAMTIAASYEEIPEDKKESLMKLFDECRTSMKNWLDNGLKESFLSRYLLIEAEYERIQGNQERALNLYDQAIDAAREANLLQHEALANLLAARIFLMSGKAKIASAYLFDARYLYQRWGALAIVSKLDNEYGEYFTRYIPRSRFDQKSNTLSSSTGSTRGGTLSTRGQSSLSTADDYTLLDINTIIKASRVLSGEIVLDKLINHLMEIAIQNAGAERGLLLLKENGSFTIRAEASLRDENLDIRQNNQGEGINQNEIMSQAVVNFVIRSKEYLLIPDATGDARFVDDSYIQNNQTRSLLCVPLIHKQIMLGLLYLENNLATETFTKEHLELLRVLSSQMAVSLENAGLYQTLEQKVEDRTRELSLKTTELEKTLQRVTEMRNQIIMQEKMASLGTLTAGIAHEIRNPLNFVKNFSELSSELLTELKEDLDKGESGEDVLELLQDNMKKISEHGNRANRIVSGMLTHASPSSGEFDSVDINYLIDDTIDLAYQGMRAQEPGMDITIVRNFSESLQPVSINTPDVSRVFLNIINNALYFAHERKSRENNGFTPELKISTEESGDFIIVKIRDNGKGISKEAKDKIFTPFFTTKPTGKGIGLGLSMSYDIIVQQHGGSLEVFSTPGEYSEFVVKLPKSVSQLSD